MPDISMCQNGDCPLCFHCLRYVAEPGERQCYADFAPREGEDRCEYYIYSKIG